MRRFLPLFLVLAFASLSHAGEQWLSHLDLSSIKQGWGTVQRDQAVTQVPLSIGGKAFATGIGTHAPAFIPIQLDGQAERLTAMVGVDDNAGKGKGSVQFRVVGGGKTLWQSPILKAGEPAQAIDVSLKGVQTLYLIASDAGDGQSHDHANWADAKITFAGDPPVLQSMPEEERVILTPPPPASPQINGPRVYGCRPGNPFLYRIPCTGERPMTFSVEGLPKGLSLDSETGIITGTVPERGEHPLTLRARNKHGEDQVPFRIHAGDTLSLTPQMGYNHWYAHYNRITQRQMEEAADLLVSTGMADAGYQYVNIDDCWMKKRNHPPYRDADGAALPNDHFPDMKGLADYIHAKGLKAGLYTSPGPWTCAGYVGAWQHEAAEIARYAEWGYDFLKHDWCSYSRVVGGKDLATYQKPYRLISELIRQQNRDIVLNLCQYGMGDVWKWGREVGGQSWRTGGDLGFELHRIFEIALNNCAIREYNRPGGFNDPDYIQIGWIGTAKTMGELKPCPLTPNEQYSFMSLWCLMASPLFFSGDMPSLDPFTLNILTNRELIAINQDELGLCARIADRNSEGFILVKELADGSTAIGLANTNPWPVQMTVTWEQAGLQGPQILRDCWRQKDLGTFDGNFTVEVPARFVFTLRSRTK